MLEHNVVQRLRRAASAALTASRAYEAAASGAPPEAAQTLRAIAACHRRQTAELAHLLAQTRARTDVRERPRSVLARLALQRLVAARLAPLRALRTIEHGAVRACERVVHAQCPSFVGSVVAEHLRENLDHMVRLAGLGRAPAEQRQNDGTERAR